MQTSRLPEDWPRGAFGARLLGTTGPVVFGFLDGAAFDLTPAFGTASRWLNEPDPIAAIRRGAPISFDLPAALEDGRLLAPIDLQAVKAAGVTYVRSMLERVIEERCRGDASQAVAVRDEVRSIIGDDLASIRPGSEPAVALKAALVAKGWWSQYLEVGIGPLAEIFTKCQPMAAVGPGADIGVHPDSAWSNPEPEVVLAVSSAGRIQGAMLGNDVNLRDIEGRSALLLGRAKDNNAACALGPVLRLFDTDFPLAEVTRMTMRLRIAGEDGFALDETGEIGAISRSPEELVGQLVGPHHQYPDGAVLFLGTPFSPAKDRGAAGQGFTHHPGDVVAIGTPRLGQLVNMVKPTDACPPWKFGAGALFESLTKRGLPRA